MQGGRSVMRVVTWNINSVRLRLEQLARLSGRIEPDVICLQETKVANGSFPAAAIAEMGFPHQLVHGMKSYNGVAILSKHPFEGAAPRDWCGKQDCRHGTISFGSGLEIHNFYVPAGGDVPDPDENEKFKHKLAFVDEMADVFAAANSASKILVGDLNIAPLENDVWSHKQLLKIVSHTPVEVEKLTRAQQAHSWVDAMRHFVPDDRKLYTWWSYRARDWAAADKGRRLDHVWVTPDLTDRLEDAQVLKEVRGWEQPSDHAPVVVDIAVEP